MGRPRNRSVLARVHKVGCQYLPVDPINILTVHHKLSCMGNAAVHVASRARVVVRIRRYQILQHDGVPQVPDAAHLSRDRQTVRLRPQDVWRGRSD